MTIGEVGGHALGLSWTSILPLRSVAELTGHPGLLGLPVLSPGGDRERPFGVSGGAVAA